MTPRADGPVRRFRPPTIGADPTIGSIPHA